MECQSITTFKLSNTNTASVENNVALNGISGGNEFDSGGDIKRNSLITGHVNAVVNVLNIINTNAVNSRWTLVTFNVFGGWEGDLIMPSELYFSDMMSVGSTDDGDTEISQVEKVILDINNDNTSIINNDVNLRAISGGNTMVSEAPNLQQGGDVIDNTITAGNTKAQANTQNITNITLYNSQWFLGLVNVMGSWSGEVFSLPDSVAVKYSPTGFSFVSSNNPEAQARLLAQLKDPIATSSPESTSENPEATSTTDSLLIEEGSASSTTESTVEIDNVNVAAINNSITVNAISGINSMTADGDIKNNELITGNATALLNLLNFANANLVNSDLFVGLINIFGDWNGNVIFGYPDLAVSQAASAGFVPTAANSDMSLDVNLANAGNGSCRIQAGMEIQPRPVQFCFRGPCLSLHPECPGRFAV